MADCSGESRRQTDCAAPRYGVNVAERKDWQHAIRESTAGRDATHELPAKAGCDIGRLPAHCSFHRNLSFVARALPCVLRHTSVVVTVCSSHGFGMQSEAKRSAGYPAVASMALPSRRCLRRLLRASSQKRVIWRSRCLLIAAFLMRARCASVASTRCLTRRSTGRAGMCLLACPHRRGPPVSLIR